MILLLIAALMGLTALALVAYPLLGIDRSGEAVPFAGLADGASKLSGSGAMSEPESAARQALLDVDFDYRLGNLDSDDYSQLRERYEERALLGLKARYEREQALDVIIEGQLAAMKPGEKKPSAVTTTGAPVRRAVVTQKRGAERRRRRGG